MREIIYRAWDGQKMLEGQDMMNKTVAQLNTWSDRVMQFTGLHDRNGKRIFEGDILQHAIETPLGIKVVRGAMYYNKQLAQFGVDMEVTDEDIKVLGATFSVKESVSGRPEVIGNIYENADLLHGLSKAS